MNEIRYIREGDATRVAEIQVNAWKSAYRGIVPQEILDRFDLDVRVRAWEEIISESPERNNIVIDDSGIMGWASYGACRDADKDRELTQELWGIYVDPSEFRSGYGQKLWQRAKKEMLEHRPQEITLWVLEKNAAAIAFYESNGFLLDGVKKAPEWLQGAVEVRMSLDLKT